MAFGIGVTLVDFADKQTLYNPVMPSRLKSGVGASSRDSLRSDGRFMLQ